MTFFDFVKNIFPNSNPKKNTDMPLFAPKFKVLIIEFSDNVEGNSGEIITRMIRNKEGLEVYYFDEPFNKNFLSLDSKELFDWIDRGQTIIDRTGADVIVWGFREGDKLRLNFQSTNQYESNRKIFISLMDSLYIPASNINDEVHFPTSLIDLIHGAIISTVEAKDNELKIYRKYLLRKIINRLINDDSAKSLSIDFMPYLMNFLGIIYLSYAFENTDDKDFKIIKNLFETGIKHQDLITNPIHLGCIYYHLGQLYDCASNNINKHPLIYFKGAIEYYIQSQKYLSKYNYPYEYGSVCYRLSSLYFNYWKQKSDLQALRDAVFQLREAEKIYTYALFPEFWANIQENLGHLLAILGNLTNSNEISGLAIESYKNKQKVITEKKSPISWAQTQSEIGDIYYRLGKSNQNKELFEDALEYFHDALYIFENAKMDNEIKKLSVNIAKTSQNIGTF
ncbi:MAG: tetratricopeptide repeat protein [Alphaproteobacteria bacterium]|nr:tetratricopeptide repeat protein [Alphaproteobacteria bacterium]